MSDIVIPKPPAISLDNSLVSLPRIGSIDIHDTAELILELNSSLLGLLRSTEAAMDAPVPGILDNPDILRKAGPALEDITNKIDLLNLIEQGQMKKKFFSSTAIKEMLTALKSTQLRFLNYLDSELTPLDIKSYKEEILTYAVPTRNACIKTKNPDSVLIIDDQIHECLLSSVRQQLRLIPLIESEVINGDADRVNDFLNSESEVILNLKDSIRNLFDPSMGYQSDFLDGLYKTIYEFNFQIESRITTDRLSYAEFQATRNAGINLAAALVSVA